MHNFIANYEKILGVLREIDEKESYLFQIRRPKLSDKELLALNLTSEYLGIDSESHLFRLLPKSLRVKIDRSVYNRRKRKLFEFQEILRLKLANRFNEFEDYFIIDSMPLEICKLSRSRRSTICRNTYKTAPDRGYCASQKTSYYGYKLHAVCSVAGVFESIDISKASVHDIHYLKDVKHQLNNCKLLADKGYLSTAYQIDLFETAKIKLETPMRKNQHNYQKQPYIFRKSRKRIETLFSQLCDQFMIRRNYAKSFIGFKTRILSKITALTIIQFINKFHFDREINKVKIEIT